MLGIFRELESEGAVKLGGSGHPTKKHAPCSAEEAYAKIACDARAKSHVMSLHEKLLDHDIWVWPLGSIENHLGNDSKAELGLVRYADRLKEEGVEGACPDPDGIHKFVDWIGS